MNDLTFDLDHVTTSMYADDTTFYDHANSQSDIQCLIQEDMTKDFCSKLSRLLGLLNRINVYLTQEAKCLFYNSYVVPVFTYCITVWGQCATFHLERIFRLQNRFLRIILNDFNSSSTVLFDRLKWLTVYEYVEYQTAILMFKCIVLGNVPDYIKDMFSPAMQSRYNLRHQNVLTVPRPRTEMLRNME